MRSRAYAHVGPLLCTRDLAPGVHSFAVEATDGDAVAEVFQLEVLPRTSPTRYLESSDAAAAMILTGESPASSAAASDDEGSAPADAGASVEAADVLSGGDGGSSLPLVFGLLAAAGVAGAAAFGVRRRHRRPG